MKVIIPHNPVGENEEQRPNYKARRDLAKRISKAKGSKATKTDVEKFLTMMSLQRQIAKKKVTAFDNEEIFPNGTVVKINYEAFSKRNPAQFTEEYLAWVEENKDREFHLEREPERENNLVMLEEDIRFNEDGEQKPKWLFDLFSDLLVQDESGEWILPADMPGALGDYDFLNKKEEPAAATETEKVSE